MGGCGTLDLGCRALGAASNATVELLRSGAAWVVATTFGWWVRVDPVSITGSSAAGQIRGYVLPLALIVATAGVAWQGVRMAVARRPAPLLDAGRGLVALAVWSAGGIVLADRATVAADGFANWVLDRAGDGAGIDRLTSVLALETLDNPGAVLLLALVVMVAGLVQAMVMLLREAALVVLAGVVVLAAAGQATQVTRQWLPRVLGWGLALVAYKPAAALVYAAALALMGDDGDPRTVMVGVMMMVLSLVALPALMKFFTWAVPSGSGGGGGGLAGAMVGAAGTAATLAAVRGGAGGPQAHAGALRADLGSPTPAAPSGPSGSATGPAAPAAPPVAAPSAGGGAVAGAATAVTAAKSAADAAAAKVTDDTAGRP